MNNSRPRFGILLMLGLTLFSFAIAFYAMNQEEAAETTFKEQFQLLQSGKFTEAYYAYASKEFQQLTPLETFKNFIRSYSQIGTDATLKIDKKSIGSDQAALEVEIHRENLPPIYFEINLIKENEEWKILGWHEYNAEEKELLSALDTALNLIREGKISQVYEKHTSSNFRRMTGLDGFQDFIANYPILTDFTASTLTNAEQEPEHTLLHVEFKNSVQKATMLFTMDQEEGTWKIRGIRVEAEDILPGVAEPFREEVLWKVVEGQLTALKRGKIETSYQEYTSSGFQKDTPLEGFIAFIHKHPIFTHYKKASFATLTFNNNIGILTALLEQDKGPTQQAEFSLIHENGAWKVLQIQLYEPPTP